MSSRERGRGRNKGTSPPTIIHIFQGPASASASSLSRFPIRGTHTLTHFLPLIPTLGLAILVLISLVPETRTRFQRSSFLATWLPLVPLGFDNLLYSGSPDTLSLNFDHPDSRHIYISIYIYKKSRLVTKGNNFHLLDRQQSQTAARNSASGRLHTLTAAPHQNLVASNTRRPSLTQSRVSTIAPPLPFLAFESSAITFLSSFYRVSPIYSY